MESQRLPFLRMPRAVRGELQGVNPSNNTAKARIESPMTSMSSVPFWDVFSAPFGLTLLLFNGRLFSSLRSAGHFLSLSHGPSRHAGSWLLARLVLPPHPALARPYPSVSPQPTTWSSRPSNTGRGGGRGAANEMEFISVADLNFVALK